jgi:hypothetical protein
MCFLLESLPIASGISASAATGAIDCSNLGFPDRIGPGSKSFFWLLYLQQNSICAAFACSERGNWPLLDANLSPAHLLPPKTTDHT